jgi:hypothetical protein
MLKYIFIYHIDKPRKLHKRGHAKWKSSYIYPRLQYNKQRRIKKLYITIKDAIYDSKKFIKDEYIVISIDSTGIRVTNNRSHQWTQQDR